MHSMTVRSLSASGDGEGFSNSTFTKITSENKSLFGADTESPTKDVIVADGSERLQTGSSDVGSRGACDKLILCKRVACCV